MSKIWVLCGLLLAIPGCKRWLYQPTKTPDTVLKELEAADRWQRDVVTLADGTRIEGLVRPAPEQGDDVPWLLFFGGNSMGLRSNHWVLGSICSGACPWGLATYAYRGYDGSEGYPSERVIRKDAIELAIRLIAYHGISSQQLVLVGQSLGSGVAIQVAAYFARHKQPVGGIVTVAGYSSITEVVGDIFGSWVGAMFPNWWDSAQFAPGTLSPALLVHGTDDTLIKPKHAHQLARVFGERAAVMWIEGAGHNNMWKFPKTSESVREFVARAVTD